jgi:hypothetical protein
MEKMHLNTQEVGILQVILTEALDNNKLLVPQKKNYL